MSLVKKKRSLLRDFVVYFASSFQLLILREGFRLFIKEILDFPKWKKYRGNSKSILEQRIPWMAFEVIRFLECRLTKDMVVFEYGSGGSTLFISDRVHKIYSVEHNTEWFEQVRSIVQKEGIRNIEYSLFSPVVEQNNSKKDCSDPVNYRSCMGGYENFRFDSYVKSIERFDNGFFDFVIIDGRARPSCILHAMQKVKQNGTLLIDNTDRGYYLQPFSELFDNSLWEHKKFKGHTPYGLTSVLYSTSIFIKR